MKKYITETMKNMIVDVVKSAILKKEVKDFNFFYDAEVDTINECIKPDGYTTTVYTCNTKDLHNQAKFNAEADGVDYETALTDWIKEDLSRFLALAEMSIHNDKGILNGTHLSGGE